MSVVSLEDALLDSTTLNHLAEEAGVTRDEAKRVCGALADIPIAQAIRLCTTARLERLRQRARAQRKLR